MLAVGRESSAPPMSCLFGILCHATFDGFHSVANIENRRSAPSAPQLGQGGALAAEAETSSSNSSPHDVQWYSEIGMEAGASRIDFLGQLAALQGVEPSDDDLRAVLGFLEAILPDLARLEEELQPGSGP